MDSLSKWISMTEPTSSVAGFAMWKMYGIKAALGMLGAALLYIVLPPLDKDGSFNEREFVFRVAFAGMFSMIFGDWVVDILTNIMPWLSATHHTAPIYLMVGAPGWWVSRAVALWFKNRQGKDIEEIYKSTQQNTKKED